MVVRVVSFHGFVHLVVVHVTVAKGDAFASTPVVKLGLFGRCLKDVATFIVAAKCCSMAWFSWWVAVGSGCDAGRVGFFWRAGSVHFLSCTTVVVVVMVMFRPSHKT